MSRGFLGRIALASILCTSLALVSCGGGGGGGGGSSGRSGGSAGAGGGTPPGALASVRLKMASIIDREGEGFLERTAGGTLLLHVKGAPYEMGRQYGALAGDRIESLVGILPAFVQTQNFPAWLLPSVTIASAAIFRPLFPSDTLEMIRGIVAGNRTRRLGSPLHEEDLIFLTSIVDLGAIVNGFITCSSIAAWGPFTVEGKMFQTRNVDLFTGSGLEDHVLMVVEKREGKTPWINCGWAGMLGGISGMNAHGVAIGQVWGFSQDRAFARPWGLVTREIMEEALNADHAVRIFSARRPSTYGSNFVFGDKGDGRGGAPKAYAIESSANMMAVFGDDDPAEDRAVVQTPNGPESYAVKLPFAVFRGDCCLDPALRAAQTASHGPTGDPRTAGAYQSRYKGQADSLLRQTANGTVRAGIDEFIQLTRDVGMRNNSLQCCAYANSDLEVFVANASLAGGTGQDAWMQPYVRYDFNYYLPTVRVRVDRADYVPGEAQVLTLEWETLGCDRDLVAAISMEGAGGTHAFAEIAGPLPLAFRAPRGVESRALPVTVPLAAAPGSYRVVVRLYERGTLDLVDVGTAAFAVR